MDMNNPDAPPTQMRYRHLEDVIVESTTPDDRIRQEREIPYRYGHLNESDKQTVESVMAGKVKSIPKTKSKVIKVFISSTFTDMLEERNALAESVYPKLRDYCRDKHGVDFQAEDMRWGIPVEASNDHSVTDLCMSELYHCQDLSIGPHFAALIGQKYGFCPTPAAIERSIFESLVSQLKNAGESTELLDKCYQRDQNVTPSQYRLMDKSSCSAVLNKPWDTVETELKECIARSGQMAVDAAEMSQETLRLLTCSVTEHEIEGGLLGIKKSKDRENNCVVVLRDIDDLFDNLSCPKAKRFCDMEAGSDEVKAEARIALNKMRAKVLESVPRFNVFQTKVQWTEQGINPVSHKDYLSLVCNHFYHTVRALADRNVQAFSSLASDELYHEVVQHWTLVKSRCTTFVGRTEQLHKFRKFLTSDTDQALVIHGESGVGKTSFMAKAASMVNSILPMQAFVIPRFIGITPKSSNIQQLLYSVCHQLAYVTGGYRHEVPEDYKSLKIYFIDRVQRGDFPGVVVLILDSLDQLSTSNGGDKLDWLPARVAPNVKIVVSTLPARRSILDRLISKIKQPMIEVDALPPSDCEQIFKVLLEASNRSVTLHQYRVIQEAFTHCTLPLFITLTFEEAARWRSFDEVSRESLEYTVEASINKLFDRLETKHGKVFVSRALGYITASRSGISDTELEDILSLDDHVLNDLFSLWLPPIRRVPSSLWPRLYLDIKAFLVEREADDIVVLSWYHQQFLDSATDRYLSDYLDRNQMHRNIADYYMGSWSGTIKKPFIYSETIMERYGLKHCHGMACRYVPEQPLIFRATEISERFNYRKMSQLPYSLLHSMQFDKLKAECLCNYEWLHTKLRATSLQQVIADFTMLDDPKEAGLVADALRMSGSALKINPDALGPEITGRLLPHIHRYHWIKVLVKQCDLVSQKRCPLVPNCQIYTAPGGPLQYECELDANITSSIDVDVFNTAEGILMTAKPFYSTKLKVWELTQGEPRQDMQLPVGEVYPTRDGKFLAILKGSKNVLIYKTDCGELHGKISCEYGEVVSVAMGNRYLILSIDRGVGPFVMDLFRAELLHKFSSHSDAVAISGDESHMAFNSGSLIIVHSLPTMERRCVGQASDVPVQLAFTQDASRCYILTKSKLLQVMHFDPINKKSSTHDILSDFNSVEFILSHNESCVLVRANRCLYLVCSNKLRLSHRLCQAHPGVFVETMTSFTGAGFSPADDMVVASRYTYIFVWSTATGEPIRVLQASLSPIVKIYTSDTANKAVALLKDNTLQVWNLDNLDANILHANEIMKGRITSVSASCKGERVICHDHTHSEISIVNLYSGKVAGTLTQPESEVRGVAGVKIVLKGAYAVTRNIRAIDEDEEEHKFSTDREFMYDDTPRSIDSAAMWKTIKWCALNDDVIWSMVSRKAVFKLPNNRFVVSDRQDTTLGFVNCTFHSVYDWPSNLYSFVAWRPVGSNNNTTNATHTVIHNLSHGKDEDSTVGQQRKVDFPEMSEFVCPPVLYTDTEGGGCQSVIAVLQVCHKQLVGQAEGARTYDNVLFFASLDKRPGESQTKTLHITDLLRFCDPSKDRIAHVYVTHSNLLLIYYVKGVTHFTFDLDQGLVIPPGLDKGAVLYNPKKGMIVRHLPVVLDPKSDFKLCLWSKTTSVFVDNNLCVFNTISFKAMCRINAELDPANTVLALDGAYIVGLDITGRCLYVYRTADGHKMGSLFIHGKAGCINIAEDDRTIVVGCDDGRVLILSLVLGLSDPYKEFIAKLPYRTREFQQKMLVESGDYVHLLNGDFAAADGKKPELLRLSDKIRTDVRLAVRKQASFKSLANAVLIANKQGANSKMCCIQ
ncbi:NACHT and WD repeat domain-containing protein 1 [Plakobranchus ocellatus]|uniref:NACHT and WD repeat domain-containing protein 1 n=1 Tax=Plakobranchus ocellatus TaxID=259542 RepID=A0AAV4DAG9_9GAST|nr:NACHT and WD repeat domain-containing protein 1 [Plakobranchus ocellatus]